ncbi:MAG: substrate-binding domain-containing protein [Alphaproteobacteria bacterium]|jgi:tungstate transport system substrate-binding protein
MVSCVCYHLVRFGHDALRRRRNRTTGLAALLVACFLVAPAQAGTSLILQSTTSTDNSGLYDYLLPHYAAISGTEVKVVAVGTGQALENARNCDGDIVIAHARELELDFVSAGYGTERHDLMYNDFVILGPQQDPAGIATAKTVGEAMQAIRAHGANFASRGDNSGTNRAERRLWKAGGHIPDAGDSGWYLETGMGMGATLNFAVQAEAYTISDRATWLAFGNKAGHEILFEGDPNLFNQYGVIPVSPARCPMIKHQAALDFRDWLVSADGQSAIAAFQKHGSQLFFPNAAVAGSALASRQGTVSSPPPGMTASVN